jgi:hypothetical protein
MSIPHSRNDRSLSPKYTLAGEPGLEILQAEIVQWLREARVGRRVLEGELAGFELARGHVRPGQSQLTRAIAIAHQGDQLRGAVLGQQHHL